jgi:hypothetical protein
MLRCAQVGIKTPYEFPRIDFLAGFDQHGYLPPAPLGPSRTLTAASRRCADAKAIKAMVVRTREEFKRDEEQFRTFYMWAFDFLKEKPSAKSMGPDTALVRVAHRLRVVSLWLTCAMQAGWQVLLDGRWPLLTEFCTFFEVCISLSSLRGFPSL